MVKSFEQLSLTQILQLYLKVEPKFDPSYRKKSQKIFRQLFNLESLKPSPKESDHPQSMQRMV